MTQFKRLTVTVLSSLLEFIKCPKALNSESVKDVAKLQNHKSAPLLLQVTDGERCLAQRDAFGVY